MPKIVNGGPFGLFENRLCCKKLKGTLWTHYKNENVNFQQSHSVEKFKRDPLGFINIRGKISKIQGETLWCKKNVKNT